VVRPQYAQLYEFNPIAALVLALRDIILRAQAPRGPLLVKLALVSFFMLGFGWLVFRRLRHRFYDYL
jgi:lipopolysaccharide transport system permease protein